MLNLIQAFELITSKRGWYNELGYTFNKGNLIKMRYRNDCIGLKTIKKVLADAGYTECGTGIYSPPAANPM